MRCLLVAAWCAAASAQLPIRGFPAAEAAARHAREREMRSIPKPANIGEDMKRMSAEPHIAGSPASRAVAEYALGLLQSWGLDARLEEFEALMPYPTRRALEMTAPVRYTAKLAEPRVAEDPD